MKLNFVVWLVILILLKKSIERNLEEDEEYPDSDPIQEAISNNII